MEGKRFGFGLAAGLLVALALVTVSGGLGPTPLTVPHAPYWEAAPGATTTVSTSTMATLTTTAAQTVTVSSTTPVGGLNTIGSNVTTSYATAATTTFTPATSTTSAGTGNYGRNNATAATNAVVAPLSFFFPPGTKNPSRLESIAQQPAVSNAVILAPVLVAFLLGAFLYRAAAQRRESISVE